MKLLLIVITILILLAGFWFYNTQSRLYVIDAPLPDNFPHGSFSHDQFEILLKQFVDPQGNINYQAFKDSPNAHLELTRYLSAVAQYSPDNARNDLTPLKMCWLIGYTVTTLW